MYVCNLHTENSAKYEISIHPWLRFSHTWACGGSGGFRPPQNPKYPTQNLARLGASAKFWQKRVFKGLFERFSDLPQAFFGKLPYPDFWSCPRLVFLPPDCGGSLINDPTVICAGESLPAGHYAGFCGVRHIIWRTPTILCANLCK